MSFQFSLDRLGDHTKIAPANVPNHKTAGGCIYLVNVHRARVSQQAVNVLSKVAETMDHFRSWWTGNLDLDCCAHFDCHVRKPLRSGCSPSRRSDSAAKHVSKRRRKAKWRDAKWQTKAAVYAVSPTDVARDERAVCEAERAWSRGRWGRPAARGA